MISSNIRIDNGGTDVAAGTKYEVRWKGMKTSELEHRKQMPFIGLCGYKAYDYLRYEI
jgi:hypothetical protein